MPIKSVLPLVHVVFLLLELYVKSGFDMIDEERVMS